MAIRKVKCPTCNTMNNKEDTIKINNRYYCISCGEERQKEIEKNTDGWDQLFEYICELYNIEKPTGMMFKQIKDFRDEPYNYTNTGMYLSLKYYYETLGNEVKEDTGLGIIPYYYEKAKKQFIDIHNIKKYMNEFEESEEEKTIKIFPPKLKPKIENIHKLSFENIKWEDD